MIRKELCFNIEGQSLYLEQVLVDYMCIPIFFICKDIGHYYVVLCFDLEELKYIIVKTSMSDIYELLHGHIPMRDVIMKQNYYWCVVSGDDVSSDIVEKYEIKYLDETVLPERGACFKILTKEVKDFVEKFDNMFLEKEFFVGTNKEGIFIAEDSINIAWADTIEYFLDLGDYFAESSVENPSAEMGELKEFIPQVQANRIISKKVLRRAGQMMGVGMWLHKEVGYGEEKEYTKRASS